jgi:hypothetical protein
MLNLDQNLWLNGYALLNCGHSCLCSMTRQAYFDSCNAKCSTVCHTPNCCNSTEAVCFIVHPTLRLLYTLHEPKKCTTALQTLQETVVQVLCYLSKFHISPNKTCPTSLTWVMMRGGRRKNWMVKIENVFLLNNQPDALFIQIDSVIKLYMFWATSLPIIRSLLLYIWH